MAIRWKPEGPAGVATGPLLTSFFRRPGIFFRNGNVRFKIIFVESGRVLSSIVHHHDVRHCVSPYCSTCLCASFKITPVLFKFANAGVREPREPGPPFPLRLIGTKALFLFFERFLVRAGIDFASSAGQAFAGKRAISVDGQHCVRHLQRGQAVVFETTAEQGNDTHVSMQMKKLIKSIS